MAKTRVLDATGLDGSVKSTRGGLMIADKQIPLADVGILLIGYQTTVSGGALAMLAKYDVVMLTLDWRGIPLSVTYPFSENTRVAARHIAQAEMTLPRKKNAWQQIVKAKIAGQRNVLRLIQSEGANRLDVLIGEVKSGDPGNIEGQAAKHYWNALFCDEFRREPGSGDRLNGMLNYGYAILRGHVIRAIVQSGLWPTLGIWHRNRANAFCLADDLIESFRPAVDWTVWQHRDSEGLEDPDVKKNIVAAFSEVLETTGFNLVSSVEKFAQHFARYCENEEPSLQVPVWSAE